MNKYRKEMFISGARSGEHTFRSVVRSIYRGEGIIAEPTRAPSTRRARLNNPNYFSYCKQAKAADPEAADS